MQKQFPSLAATNYNENANYSNVNQSGVLLGSAIVEN